MARQSKALLAVWTDIPADLEYAFNEWYNRDHMRERILGVPGFSRGRRFVAYSGGPKYLAVYEAGDAAVLMSEPYCRLVRNPDPLSRTFIPRFQNTIKGICDVAAEAGEAEGAAIAVLPLTRIAGREDDLRAWIADSLLPALVAGHGVVAARYAVKNAGALSAGTSGHMRPTDTYIDALLMVEAVSEADLMDALPLLDAHELSVRGAQPDGEPRLLDVIYTLHVPQRAIVQSG